MNQVTEHLWIGDLCDARELAALKAVGINAVVSVAPDPVNWADESLAYCQLNQDDGAPIPFERLDEFLRQMTDHARGGRVVLIHCAAGVSRAASFTIAWLMHGGMSWNDAETILRGKRDVINPHPALKHSVLAYFASKRPTWLARESSP